MQCVFRYLAEGILPTTNEISVLKYLEEGEQEFTQNSDGFFIRRLPAKLLQEMNVVDTPGTNVILDRQQRLTEEYVPRADLVLFVMSADRPFTESEVNFLKYIRQWGKKVIFLVNKVCATASSCNAPCPQVPHHPSDLFVLCWNSAGFELLQAHLPTLFL